MTAVPGYKSRVVCGDFSFSAFITDVSEPFTADMLDVTVNASPNHAREYIAGQSMSTFSLKGFLDPDGTANGQYDQINTWLASAGSEAVTFGPSGLSFGSEVLLSAGLVTKYEIDAAVASPVGFSIDCQNAGRLARGWSLHDETAETADASSAAHDGGAASTTGGIAHLHATAYAGLDSAVFTIEDSANGTTGWSTIGTFATVTGLAQERLTIAGAIKRYTRVSVDVTGTGSVTYAVGLART